MAQPFRRRDHRARPVAAHAVTRAGAIYYLDMFFHLSTYRSSYSNIRQTCISLHLDGDVTRAGTICYLDIYR